MAMKFSLNFGKKDHTSGSPDKLIETSPKGAVELSEGELDKVSGGAVDTFLKLDGIKGESQDDSHKSSIEISSFKTP
jgi:hypothetical protein